MAGTSNDENMIRLVLKADEKRKLRDRFQTMGVEIPVAKDGLSVYLHESNPVKELSIGDALSALM